MEQAQTSSDILATWNDPARRPLVLTIAEAGTLLNLDRRTVMAMLRCGDLAGNIASRGAARVSSASVVDWLSGKRGVLCKERRKS